MSADERLEGRLRERGRRLGLDPLTEAGAERIRARVGEERERLRRRRFTRIAAGLAAAAAIVATGLVWLAWLAAPADRGQLLFELALLDEAGRELEGAEARGPGDPYTPPAEVLLELVPLSAGFVQVLVYDPLGTRDADAGVAPIAVAAAETRTWSLPLADYSLPASGPASVALVSIGSLEPVTPREVAAYWPRRLDHASGPERAAELDALAATITRELGCTVFVVNVPLRVE